MPQAVAAALDGGLIVFLCAMLLSGKVAPARAFAIFALLVMVTGRVNYTEAMRALGTPAIWAVVSLVIFSLALGKLALLRRIFFGRKPRGLFLTQVRMLTAAATMSAFVPNTAVVASMLGPASRRPNVTAHQLLLPLSYMALVAGMITPFGTSASLMVVGLASDAGVNLDVLDFAGVGMLATGVVLLTLVIISPILLAERRSRSDTAPEIFHVEVRIEPGSKLIGRTVAENELRHLHSFYLAEIVRNDQAIAPVRPNHTLREGDRLIFVGDVAHLDEVHSLPGVTIIKDGAGHRHDKLFRAVVASSSVLTGRTLREVDFRARFDASVLAVGRASESLSGKLGDIRLRAGDLLLLAGGPDFHTRDNLRANLHILDSDEAGLVQLDKRDTMLLSLAFLGFLVAALFQITEIAFAAIVLASVTVLFDWVSPREVKRAFPFDLVIVLWGAVLLSMLVQKSGLSALLAATVADMSHILPPLAMIAAVYFMAWMLTEFFSNASAALVALPVALDTAQATGMPGEPFALAAAFGASASFFMPFGYQTHLMVMSPGWYRMSDYWRLGAGVFLAYTAATLFGLNLFQL